MYTINNLNESPLIELNSLNILEDLKDYEEMLRKIFKTVGGSAGFYFWNDLSELVKSLNESIFKNYKGKYIELLDEILSTSDHRDIFYYIRSISNLNESPLSEDLDKYKTILKYIINKNSISYREIELLNKKIKNSDNYFNIIKKIFETDHKDPIKRKELLKSLKDSNEEENLVLLNNFLDK
jgi:hypothetical protein